MNEHAIGLHGIQDALAPIGPASNAMLFIARDQREGARHPSNARSDIAQLFDAGERSRRIIHGDPLLDRLQILNGPRQ
ncbi:hypothetical protein [Sphingomonas oryzagri]